jgi:hypothetical protein
MKKRARLPVALALAFAAAAFTLACQNGVVGPSLSATVKSLALQPTVAGLDGGENVCCCHITGQVTNTSTVGEHIVVAFPAKDAAGQPLGSASAIVRDVPAGATRPFQAVGIAARCSSLSLSQIVTDQRMKVYGLWEPPE